MTCHTAAGGEDALCGAHAFHVLRIRLFADEDCLYAFFRLFNGVFRCEDDFAAGAAGSGRESFDKGLDFRFGFRIHDRVEEFVELIRGNACYGVFLGDHLLFKHVHRHVEGGCTCAFSDAALEHVEDVFLYCELDVEHVFVMLFKPASDVIEFFVGLRHGLLE